MIRPYHHRQWSTRGIHSKPSNVNALVNRSMIGGQEVTMRMLILRVINQPELAILLDYTRVNGGGSPFDTVNNDHHMVVAFWLLIVQLCLHFAYEYLFISNGEHQMAIGLPYWSLVKLQSAFLGDHLSSPNRWILITSWVGLPFMATEKLVNGNCKGVDCTK